MKNETRLATKIQLVMIPAPIKRHVSRENTYPSQNRVPIFIETKFRFELTLRPFSAPGFSNDCGMICQQAPIRIKANEKSKFTAPGPKDGPQKNIGTLSCPRGYNKIAGSLRPTIAGA